MRVARWGNSLAIRLPRSVVEALRLKEGDAIEVHVQGHGPSRSSGFRHRKS
jgi:antitoxin MazE